MLHIWREIESWLKVNAPPVLEALQVGASESQINDFEALLSTHLPEDFKSSYRIHNGQKKYSPILINGNEFLSLERIADEWTSWKSLLDSGIFNDENGQTLNSNPDPGIKNVWWSTKWIPLTYESCGDNICLDLSPAEGGTYGQIISMCHDETERALIAPSFQAWLQQYAEDLSRGKFIYVEESNGIFNIDDYAYENS